MLGSPQSVTHAHARTDSHDVCLVHGRHTAALVVSGVLEGVLCDASAGVLRDQFDALDDTINNLPPHGKRTVSLKHL